MVLHHTGQSHGRQVPHGMENLELEDVLYDNEISMEGIPTVAGVLRITVGQCSLYNSFSPCCWPEPVLARRGR